jgi:hypothetical protein
MQSPASSPPPGQFSVERKAATVDLGSAVRSTEYYDIVKVDLENGRDYPIYIGTGYSEEEGAWLFITTRPRVELDLGNYSFLPHTLTSFHSFLSTT